MIVISLVNDSDENSEAPECLDLHGDDSVTPLDSMLVINRLNEPDHRDHLFAAMDNDEEDDDSLLDEELLALLI